MGLLVSSHLFNGAHNWRQLMFDEPVPWSISKHCSPACGFTGSLPGTAHVSGGLSHIQILCSGAKCQMATAVT